MAMKWAPKKPLSRLALTFAWIFLILNAASVPAKIYVLFTPDATWVSWTWPLNAVIAVVLWLMLSADRKGKQVRYAEGVGNSTSSG